MNQIITIEIVISLIFGVASFVATNNYIVGIICFVLTILYFLIVARALFKKYLVKINRFRECYHFINNFIVSLSIKGTISSAYDSTVSSMPDTFINSIENIESFSQKDKLEHLGKYFKFHVFSLFIDLVNLYQEQGGNILDMSHYLLEETRQIEEYITMSTLIGRKRVVEFAILWMLTISIMVFMRFALSQFFETITKQLFYPIGIGAIILFALLSIHIAISKMCKLKIKGWNDNEKI